MTTTNQWRRDDHSSRNDDDRMITTTQGGDEFVGRRGGASSFLLPTLNVCAFLFNFATFGDPSRVSHKYETLLSPPNFAFLIWIIIYAAEFAFCLYQLFSRRPRTSSLIQGKISLPWIFHQVIVAAWLTLFERESIYCATAVVTCAYLLSLLIYLLIAAEFRNGYYDDYQTKDYIFIELPFALLLGWETLATCVSWNLLLVKLGADGVLSMDQTVSAEICGLLITFAVIAIASVFYCGLAAMVNPISHIPIIWGLFTIAYRWSHDETVAAVINADRAAPVQVIDAEGNVLPQIYEWASPRILNGISLGCYGLCAMTIVLWFIAIVLTVRTQLWMPYTSSEMRSEVDCCEEGCCDSKGRSPTPKEDNHRSPRTARSALSAEQNIL